MPDYLIHTKQKAGKWLCLIYYGTQLVKATKPDPDLGKIQREAQTFVNQKTFHQEEH